MNGLALVLMEDGQDQGLTAIVRIVGGWTLMESLCFEIFGRALLAVQVKFDGIK